MDYYDKEIEVTSPHLLDSVHWCNPAEKFPQHIKREGEYFITTSRYGNWTNNPCLYKKDFYLETVKQTIDFWHRQARGPGKLFLFETRSIRLPCGSFFAMKFADFEKAVGM